MVLWLACAAPPIVLPTVPSAALALPDGRRDRWADVPPADGFDAPVYPPDGVGARVAQGFGTRGHLGLDVNAKGACDDDLGVPVSAAATGVVSVAEDVGGGWGNVVQIVHRTDEGLVQTLSAHLDRIDVVPWQLVRRGDVIGTIGNAHGVYCAHLHFEVRADPDAEIGGGYAAEPPEAARDPAAFLTAHASARP